MSEELLIASCEAGGGEQHEPIVFSLQQEQQPDRALSALDEEREKHRRRAERFKTLYKDPGRVRKDFGLMMEARKERLRASHGFTTGSLDVFSPEELEKRAARAARFRLEAPLAPSLESYRPDEELEARARRAVKFGVPYQPTEAVLMDMDLFEQRREVGTDVERRPDAVYLYGVDVMSTKDVLKYFGEYGPVFVEWLDDSSCNVLFSDANSAKRAMVGKGTPLPPEVVAGPPPGAEPAAADQQQPVEPQTDQQQQEMQVQQHENGAGDGEAARTAAAAAGAVAKVAEVPVRYQPELPVPDNLGDVANMPYIWHKGQDFVRGGTSISLVYRLATVEDVRDMNQPKRTRELWRAGGGGERGGRGRQKLQQRRGKRPFRRGAGDGYGPADMDVDDDGPGAGVDGDEGGDMPMKRPRGARGGQRHAMKEMRPSLQPYGGTSLLQAGAAVLQAKGHVLDYTELEDEDPTAAAGTGAGLGAETTELGVKGQHGGGRGRRGRRGGGGSGGDGGFDGDLRELLKARRRAVAPPLDPDQEGGYQSAAAGGEIGGGEGNGHGGVGDGAGEEGEYGGEDTGARMDE